MESSLKNIWKGKVVIVGIGKSLRGDDAAGSLLSQHLDGKIDAVVFDAATAPERYTGKIRQERPDTIILIDAVVLDKEPGAFAILEKEEIVKTGFTTHDLSPRMFIEYLETETRAKIYMLGIQPQNISIGSVMSEPVLKALDQIEQLFINVKSKKAVPYA